MSDDSDDDRDIHLPIDAPRLDPGSPEARSSGCTCDPVRNRYGAGVLDEEGRGPGFFPDWDCPLHGLEAIAKLIGND